MKPLIIHPRAAKDAREIAAMYAEVPPQIKLLESWIDSNADNLTTGEYIADIGFCWRRDAGGGGSALSRELLAKMGIAGFTLFLSEYPGFGDDEDKS